MTLNSQKSFGLVDPLHQVRILQNTHTHTHTHACTHARTHAHAHTHYGAVTHAQKYPNAQIHTHLHTIMLSQHTVAGYICARAISKQLWSSYQNRSPKTQSVQLLCTKSFILLDPSLTINHRCYSVIMMYIFMRSHLTVVDWIHFANILCQEC